MRRTIDRAGLVVALALALLGPTWAGPATAGDDAAARPGPPAPRFRALAGADRDALDGWLEAARARGDRPVSLHAHPGPRGPRYAALVERDPERGGWEPRHDPDVDGFQRTFEEQGRRRRWLLALAGVGAGDGDDAAAFVSLWGPGGDGACHHVLDAAELEAKLAEWGPRGSGPVLLSAYAWRGQRKYAAVWDRGAGGDRTVERELDRDALVAAQARWRSEGRRPVALAVAPAIGDADGAPRFTVVLAPAAGRDGWELALDREAEQVPADLADQESRGRRPLALAGYRDRGAERFAVLWAPEPAPAALPTTGAAVPELAAFDAAMQGYMARRGIRAGTLAVARDGRLLLERGYGWRDRAGTEPLAPDAPLRLASVSKPFTAAAVRALIAAGSLEPGTKVAPRLELAPPPGATPDARWREITVAHLLDHRGGWDRDAAGDPMFRPRRIARAWGVPGPVTARQVVDYMAGEPLQFDPGAKSAYSNFGYCVLGRLIERVTGEPFEAALRRLVLDPLGIGAEVRVGRSRPADRDPREPEYDDPESAPSPWESDRPEAEAGRVPLTDGGFVLEAMDAHGGLIAPARAVARFFDAFTARGEPVAGRPVWSTFFGSLPGTFAVAHRREDGLVLVALFAHRGGPPGAEDEAILGLLRRAADACGPTARSAEATQPAPPAPPDRRDP